MVPLVASHLMLCDVSREAAPRRSVQSARW